jgi:hypothetical protein
LPLYLPLWAGHRPAARAGVIIVLKPIRQMTLLFPSKSKLKKAGGMPDDRLLKKQVGGLRLFTSPLPLSVSAAQCCGYHSVCPFVGIGTLPNPLSPASVPLPPEPGGVGLTRLRLRGWGSPNSDDWRKSLALLAYSVIVAFVVPILVT